MNSPNKWPVTRKMFPFDDVIMGAGANRNLGWPIHGFQPRTLRRLVFAVSLKFLISIDFVSNAPSYTDWHKAWNLCTGTWGHASSDIAARVGVAQETSSILLKQAATASLELGKSIGAPRKTTARQECALFRMVRQDHFKGAVPSLRGWVICMECVLVVRRLTTDLWPEDTVLAG